MRDTIEHTPTEANCGDALLYINNTFNYTVRNDLRIYQKKEIESIFIEIINPKGKNVIVGCIYRHPSLNPTEFVDIRIQELLQKCPKKIKLLCYWVTLI